MTDAHLRLVDCGRPAAAIAWWSATGSPVPRFAAAELQRYVERMSGIRLEAAEVPPPRAGSSIAGGFVIRTAGAGAHLDAPAARWADLLRGREGDAYALCTIGGDAVVGCGATPRAVLYAAYDLLERLGVRFYAPRFACYGDYAEHVPLRSTLTLPALRIVEAPAFAYRRKYVEEGWSHTPAQLRALVDWMAKKRLNVLVHPYDYFGEGVVRWDDCRDELLEAIEERGLIVEVGGHGYESFLPRSESPRHYSAGLEVFDVHRDAAVRAYVQAVVDYLRRRPEIAVFDAWPPDDKPWPAQAAARYGSVANAHAAVTNALAGAVDAAGLAVTVEALAYARHLDPPAPDHALHPSVLVDLAPYSRSYAAPIWEGPSATDRLIRDWRRAHAGRIGVCEYYRKYSWHSLPFVPFSLIAGEIPYYRSLGVSGFGIYSEPGDWITYELTHLLVADLSWDVTLDASGWRRSYLRERYGPAAGAVAAYLDGAERAGAALFDRPDGNYGSPVAVGRARERYRAARHAIAGAAGTAGLSDGAAFLLDRLAANADYAVADTEVAYRALRGESARHRDAVRRLTTLVERDRFSGTVLDSVWTARRRAPTASRADARGLYAAYRASH